VVAVDANIFAKDASRFSSGIILAPAPLSQKPTGRFDEYQVNVKSAFATELAEIET
jgi:hypothetical protein